MLFQKKKNWESYLMPSYLILKSDFRQFSEQEAFITFFFPPKFSRSHNQTITTCICKKQRLFAQDRLPPPQGTRCWDAAFAGVEENLASRPCRLLVESIRFLQPFNNRLTSLKPRQPQTPSSIPMNRARGMLASSSLPSLNRAAIPPHKQSLGLLKNSSPAFSLGYGYGSPSWVGS